MQGVDLAEAKLDWDAIDVRSTLFLGCRFPSDGVQANLQGRGALVFPRFADRPYDPYRRGLYTPAELLEGCRWGKVWQSRDRHIHAWYVNVRRHLPDVAEALAPRPHDFAIDDALGDLIGESTEARLRKRIVGIMGGHARTRDSEAYARAARVAWLLGRDHLVVTGGGPGIMEAGNLGAYLSDRSEAALETALDLLQQAPSPDDPAYHRAAEAVRVAFPSGRITSRYPLGSMASNPSTCSGRISRSTSRTASGRTACWRSAFTARVRRGIGGHRAGGLHGCSPEPLRDVRPPQPDGISGSGPLRALERRRCVPTLLAEAKDYADLLTLSDSPDEVAAFIRASAPAPRAERPFA